MQRDRSYFACPEHGERGYVVQAGGHPVCGLCGALLRVRVAEAAIEETPEDWEPCETCGALHIEDYCPVCEEVE